MLLELQEKGRPEKDPKRDDMCSEMIRGLQEVLLIVKLYLRGLIYIYDFKCTLIHTEYCNLLSKTEIKIRSN